MNCRHFLSHLEYTDTSSRPLVQLQTREEVREASLRPAADQLRAEGGLPLPIQCHERTLKTQERLGNRSDRIRKNVDHLQAQPPALRLMSGRTHPPTARDPTILAGGSRLGQFWRHCKHHRRCTRSPYDRLLTNPILRADYRATGRHERSLRCRKLKAQHALVRVPGSRVSVGER